MSKYHSGKSYASLVFKCCQVDYSDSPYLLDIHEGVPDPLYGDWQGEK